MPVSAVVMATVVVVPAVLVSAVVLSTVAVGPVVVVSAVVVVTVAVLPEVVTSVKHRHTSCHAYVYTTTLDDQPNLIASH